MIGVLALEGKELCGVEVCADVWCPTCDVALRVRGVGHCAGCAVPHHDMARQVGNNVVREADIVPQQHRGYDDHRGATLPSWAIGDVSTCVGTPRSTAGVPAATSDPGTASFGYVSGLGVYVPSEAPPDAHAGGDLRTDVATPHGGTLLRLGHTRDSQGRRLRC